MGDLEIQKASVSLGLLLLAGALLSRAGGGLLQEQLSKSFPVRVEERIK